MEWDRAKRASHPSRASTGVLVGGNHPQVRMNSNKMRSGT